MCRMCDDPNLTPADLRGQTMAAIDRYGWLVQYVEAGEGQPSFAYTVGLTGVGLPEVLVVGLPPHMAHALLNRAAILCQRELIHLNDVLEEPEAGEYRLVPYRGTEQLHTAQDVYGDHIQVLELRPVPQPWARSSSKRA